MIIAIMSGIVLTAMNKSDDTMTLNAGVTRLDSIFSLARSAAITRQQKTRVLISLDGSSFDKPNEPQLLLRYATIVYLDDDGQWKTYAEGEYLPDGVYFTPALSTKSGQDPALYTWKATMNKNTLAISDAYPELFKVAPYSLNGKTDTIAHSSDPNKWYAFEFNPNGTFHNPGARVVVTSGILNKGSSNNVELVINVEDDAFPEDSAKGFVVFRSGKVLHFQSADQIKEGQ